MHMAVMMLLASPSFTTMPAGLLARPEPTATASLPITMQPARWSANHGRRANEAVDFRDHFRDQVLRFRTWRAKLLSPNAQQSVRLSVPNQGPATLGRSLDADDLVSAGQYFRAERSTKCFVRHP